MSKSSTKRTSSHKEIVRRNLTENSNSSLDTLLDLGDNKQQRKKHLPTDFLEDVSDDILDHIKQLGLFDEMRMKLLDTIESSREFSEIRREFMKELDAFCSEVDLTLPRNRLRERLKSHTQSRAANWLTKYVQEVSYAHKNEFKMLYNEKADKYIRTMANQKASLGRTPIVIAETLTSSKKSKDNDSSINSVKNHLCKGGLFSEKSLKSLKRDNNRATNHCGEDVVRKRTKKTVAIHQ